MSIAKEKKSEQVKKLANDLRQAQSVIFAKYGWLTFKELNGLKKQLRAAWASIQVAKKTLIKIAAKEVFSIDIPWGDIEGQIALICSNKDMTSWARITKDAWKKLKALQIVSWIVESRFLNKSQALEIASLPTKEQLISKLLWTFMAPIQWFHSTTHWVISWFARVLNAHKEKLWW